MSNANASLAGHVFILGAPDPEMEAIERLINEAGVRVAYACTSGPRGGERVGPGHAYRATSVSGTSGPAWVNPRPCLQCEGEGRFAGVDAPCEGCGGGGEIGDPPPAVTSCVLVECGGTAFDHLPVVARCDHHSTGDPGFGISPDEFLRASSIGQVVDLLAREAEGDLFPSWAAGRPPGKRQPVLSRRGTAWEVVVEPGSGSGDGATRVVPDELLLVAAGDHCPGHAYRGECPGVDPEALMRWRAATRAAFQRRPVEAVLADVEAAIVRLRTAPSVVLAVGADGYDVVVRDLRGPPVPELPEAALRLGVAYLATVRDRVLLGAASPTEVEAFFSWARAQGLAGVYGDPARGFAGGTGAARERA